MKETTPMPRTPEPPMAEFMLLWGAYNCLKPIDMGAMLDSLARAEAAWPILDPTAFQDHARTIPARRKVLQCARAFMLAMEEAKSAAELAGGE